VFSLVNAVLLRPLPYPDSERIVWITAHHDRFAQDTFASRGDYLVWKQQTQVFERMAAYRSQLRLASHTARLSGETIVLEQEPGGRVAL